MRETILHEYARWLIESNGVETDFLTLVEAWPEFCAERKLPFHPLDDADLDEVDDLIAEASVAVWWEEA